LPSPASRDLACIPLTLYIPNPPLKTLMDFETNILLPSKGLSFAFRTDSRGRAIGIELLYHNKPLVQICGTINLAKQRQRYRPLRFLDLRSFMKHFILKAIDDTDGILLVWSQLADRFPTQHRDITLYISELILWFDEHRHCILHNNRGS
jgi:hypothetical protein